MKKIKLQPLTQEEKLFCEKNHNLVYKFLHIHNYSIEDFYSIAVFGFIRSTQVYHRRKDLRDRFKFSYIAFQYMRAEINNHFKQLNTQKRKPTETIISLDTDYVDMEIN